MLRRRQLTEALLIDWLRIRRSYDDAAIARSKLQVLSSDKLRTPAEFGNAVSTEREARAVVERLTELRSHGAYGSILALSRMAVPNLPSACDYWTKGVETLRASEAIGFAAL